MPLTEVSTKIHLQTDKIHKNIQDMPPKEINCIQIVKLISADFESFWWFCNVLQFCPKNSNSFLLLEIIIFFFNFSARQILKVRKHETNKQTNTDI